jgi:hypothetical protein
MNILADQIKGSHQKHVHKFAAELDRCNEELEFLEEMIYCVSAEMYTYQEEMADPEYEEASMPKYVMEKLFGKMDGPKQICIITKLVSSLLLDSFQALRVCLVV